MSKTPKVEPPILLIHLLYGKWILLNKLKVQNATTTAKAAFESLTNLYAVKGNLKKIIPITLQQANRINKTEYVNQNLVSPLCG
jgi:hypothetical protein